MAKVILTAPDLPTYERTVYSVVEATGILTAHTDDYTSATILDERGFAIHFEREIGKRYWRLV